MGVSASVMKASEEESERAEKELAAAKQELLDARALVAKRKDEVPTLTRQLATEVEQTMKDTEQFIKQSEKELNRIAAVKAKVADKLKQLEEIKAKHLTAHQSAAARHRWVKAAHMTQHSKLRATIDMVVQLQSKSSALKEQAELDRDVASTLVQHACDGMGFMPNGTGWAANGDMTGAVGMMGAPGVPQEASSGLWADQKRRGNQNVVLDLSDADAAGVLPPWYVDGFTGEPQRRGASPQPVP